MILGALLASSLQLGAASCHVINTDHIYARDLAARSQVFSLLQPDTQIALSPIPGQQRTFRPAELKKIAQANHLEGTFDQSVCFTWAMTVPSREDLLAAMNKTLSGRAAVIRIVDQSSSPLPEGELLFPLSGLSGSSEGPVLWRGTLVYSDSRTLPTWARVEISIKEQHVAASESLHPGDPIRASQLRLVGYEGPLTREPFYVSVNDVVGLTPRSTIVAGTVLSSTQLRERKEIERGDRVKVIVQSGRTRLETEGVAEEAGIKGSLIMVKNERSGKSFRGRVEDKGAVSVLPSGPTGLPGEQEFRW